VIAIIMAGMAVAAIDATSARECRVLQAVFSQELAQGAKPGPRRVQSYEPRGAPKALAAFMATLAASLDVPKESADALAVKSSKQPDRPWKAGCVWPVGPDGVPGTTNAFSRPVFSDDGRLAAFEWDAGFADINQEGNLCLALSAAGTWKVSCLQIRMR
jgi:acetyl-CoA acetyltransferase